MTRLAARPPANRSWRAVVARGAIGLVLVVVAALLWLLIVTLWSEAAGRAIPPVSALPAATGWWT